MWYTLLICFLAGLGAGLGTGLAGLSAAVVVSPMLIVFLGFPAYKAVGIALASDVLASAASAVSYGKKKNLDIKNGLVMMVAILVFTFVGSFFAKYVPNKAMSTISVFWTLVLGIKFIIRPVNTTRQEMETVSKKKRLIESIAFGAAIGLVCGFIGAGGGMMMLLILTTVLGYELKTAIGTSVFIMAFTALTGAVTHFAVSGFPDWKILVCCSLSTLLWAKVAAYFANKVDNKILNRIIGIILCVLGVAMSIVYVLFRLKSHE